ncbi:MAG: DUF924 domain-containing protein [Hydrogenophaga sp.]|uniref:DUF924 domain-containing protein n=1 Tax=Hydrogenophaga crocea TaxID=2716225 RepID=A0A6G8IDG7_9BURK|nr:MULTISPECIES: DUF924 family protein [Hydrogenophaga]MBL0942845.1 DUF924 domain-containing protein [Hydrogenophaga sp.]QIM51141.1 DUF924 domain-containing protein [Hydrogenophaga crocea]
MSPLPAPARALLDHWFGDGLARDWPSASRQALWFRSTPEQDDDLRARFGAEVAQALAGGLADWADTPEGRLALVLLLDQLPRNLFRRQARAFEGDRRAQALSAQAVEAGTDRALATVGRVFLYMPFMHAEDLALQDLCVRCFDQLRAGAEPALHAELDHHLKFAVLHRDIVARFGRFPHRNAVLGRQNTAEEDEFLKDGPRFGQ